MAKKITYGPIGTTLIQVGTDFYLGYEYDGDIYYWSIEEKDIPALSEIDTVRYDQNGILANPIEGFQYMPVSNWSDLIENKKVINIDLAKIPKVVVKKRSGETLNLKKEGKKVTKAIGSIFKKKNKKNKKK